MCRWVGIRRFSEINQALVAKLAWKMLTDRDSLWVRVLFGKYVKGRNFWAVGASGQASWIWKSIVNTRHILWEGLCYCVGSGRHIQIWEDPWVPLLPRFRPKAKEGVVISPDLVTARDLMLNDGVSWNVGLVSNLFSQDSAAAILKVRISEAGTDHSLF